MSGGDGGCRGAVSSIVMMETRTESVRTAFGGDGGGGGSDSGDGGRGGGEKAVA